VLPAKNRGDASSLSLTHRARHKARGCLGAVSGLPISEVRGLDMAGPVAAEHGIVCRLPGERLGYFGWPTVARLEDGRLVVASSGLRTEHVCPWGKTVLNFSDDDGRTWSPPQVIQDSAIDDRDAGVIGLGGARLLVSWFRSDTRQYAGASWIPEAERAKWQEVLATWTDDMVKGLLGSWILRSEDGGSTWGEPIRVPVSTPHGPIRLRSGDLLYLGKEYGYPAEKVRGMIATCRSRDDGLTWERLGTVPVCPATDPVNYHEPHVLELPSGRLLGIIRIQDHSGKTLAAAGIPHFSMMQTESDDGGVTWTQARPLGFPGSPPHLLRHSSGVVVLTYGYRLAPFGQRAALSYDDGVTWEHDWIIRDDGPDSDLGYPSTVEMADGSLFTVAYQKVPGDRKCSLLWSRWSLPG
jgi:sialidase-1